MKWELRADDHGVSFHLATDRPLPRMFDSRLLKRSAYGLSDLLHQTSPQWRMRYALRVARRNRGRLPFELVAPARVYHELLVELSAIEGIVEIRDLNRYSLLVHHGSLFRPEPLGRAVGMAISHKLYPEEAVEFDADSMPGGEVAAGLRASR